MNARWTLVLCAAVALVPSLVHAGDVVSENESEPYPGIRIVERIEANPNNRIYAAYISLCTSQVHVTATAPPTGFRTPGGWGSDVGVQLAVNGDFYTSGPQVYGDAVGGGGIPWPLVQTGNSQEGAWYHGRYGWIAFGPGWVEFNHTERTKTADAETFGVDLGWSPFEVTTSIPSGTLALVSGFPELVIEGQPYTCTSPTDTACFPDRGDMRERHPRTAMGLTEDRQTFILVAVDGRDSPASVGMYGSELAALMADLGAWEAFNIDGGGSTGMWLQGTGYLNQPSDGSPRAVANHWGIFAGEAGGQPTEPGSCFQPGGCHPTALAGAEDEPFADMPPGSPGHDEAIALLDEGIVSGCRTEPQRMFCPHCTLTRGQAASIVAQAVGLDLSTPPPEPTFDDVPPESTLYPAIEALHAAGIMDGCSATSFCPGEGLSRGLLAAVVRRAAGWELAEPDVPSFDDVDPLHPHFGDVEALAEHCVAAGCDDGEFCPDLEADRAQGAVLVTRSLGLLPGACEPPTSSGTTSGTGEPPDTGDGTGDPGGETGSRTTTGLATTGTAETDTDSPAVGGEGAGCGCRQTSKHPGSSLLFGLLVLLGLRRSPQCPGPSCETQ